MSINTTVGNNHYLPGPDYLNARKASMVLRAINHKLRQRVIEIIYTKERMNVTQLYILMGLEQSEASQHLGILRRAGIVLTEREGKAIYYTICKERIKKINQFVKDILNNSDSN